MNLTLKFLVLKIYVLDLLHTPMPIVITFLLDFASFVGVNTLKIGKPAMLACHRIRAPVDSGKTGPMTDLSIDSIYHIKRKIFGVRPSFEMAALLVIP